jgi:hypothetical protein
MSKWWIAIAMCGLAALPAAAQMPPAFGSPEAGAMPAPTGYAPYAGGVPCPPAAAQPPLVPPNPTDDDPMSLTHLGTTAFERAGSPPESWFFNVGTVAFMRQRPGSMPIGQADPGESVTKTATVTAPVTFQSGKNFSTFPTAVTVDYTTTRFRDTGIAPSADAPFIGDYHDLNTGMSWGFSGSLGFRYGDSSVELTGFYIPDNGASTVSLSSPNLSVPVPVNITSIASVTPLATAANAKVVSVDTGTIANELSARAQNQPGRIDLPFFNAPPGFQGDKGLWLQADQADVSFRSTLGDLEANYRYWASEQCQVLVGFRYVEEMEDLRIFTQDNVISSGFDDPTKDALYRIVTRNRLVTGQLGLEGECPICKFAGIGGFVKGAWGPNFLTSNVSLARGDGLVGFNSTRQTTVLGQIYEMGTYLNIYCSANCRLHAGFNLFWLAGVAEAVKQINYDLSQENGTISNSGSVFYYGPSIEVQFVF